MKRRNILNPLNNGNILYHYYRALSYKEQGNNTKAIADLESIIACTDDPQWIVLAKQEIKELYK